MSRLFPRTTVYGQRREDSLKRHGARVSLYLRAIYSSRPAPGYIASRSCTGTGTSTAWRRLSQHLTRCRHARSQGEGAPAAVINVLSAAFHPEGPEARPAACDLRPKGRTSGARGETLTPRIGLLAPRGHHLTPGARGSRRNARDWPRKAGSSPSGARCSHSSVAVRPAGPTAGPVVAALRPAGLSMGPSIPATRIAGPHLRNAGRKTGPAGRRFEEALRSSAISLFVPHDCAASIPAK